MKAKGDLKMYCNEEGKCFNTLDEMMNDYKEKQKKRPIETKIKDSIVDFFSYIFNLFRDAFYEIKWFFQRAIRGYDDTACWNLDKWFMDIFPDMLKQLIDNKHGWNPKLGYKVIDGKLVKLPENEEITADDEEAVLCYFYFKLLELRDFEDKAFDLNNMNYFEEYNKLKNETLDLFKELFFNLWD